MNKRFYSIFSGSYYVHYSSVPSYFHVGNGSLMGLLVVRILWRNVKRKQEYPNPFLKSKFSFAISLSYHVTLLWQMPLIENGFSLSLSLMRLLTGLYQLALFPIRTLMVTDIREMFYFVMIWSCLQALDLRIKVGQFKLCLLQLLLSVPKVNSCHLISVMTICFIWFTVFSYRGFYSFVNVLLSDRWRGG